MDGYIYGFEPAEISLTLMGFVMQDAFMAALAGASGDSGSLLASLTTISGLIGMSIIFLSGKKVGTAGIIGWCLIMILMVTFPSKSSTNVPDPIFYTNVAKDPVLDKVVAYGGILSQQEMEGIVGDDAEGIQYRDIVKEKMPEALAFEAIYGFTPHVQILHYLNLVNLALNVELVPFGRRAAGGSMAFIEAIKYARTADPEAPYQTAEYTLACQDSGVVRETAFRSTVDVAAKDAPSWAKLRGTKITARKARDLYKMYANYINTRGADTSMLPPLVIGACRNADCTSTGALPAAIRTAFQPIMFDSWKEHATPEKVAVSVNNLESQYVTIGQDNEKLLDTTYVQLAVPIGLNGIKENVLKAVEADSFAVMRAQAVVDAIETGDLTAAAPMMLATVLTLHHSSEPGLVSWFSGADFDESEILKGVDQESVKQLVSGMQPVTTPRGNDRYFKVGNCQQMHWIKSTRQTLATVVQMDTTNRLEALLAEYKDKPEFYNYNARTATDQAKFAAALQVRAQQGECVDTAIHRGGVVAGLSLGIFQNWAENVTASTKEHCLKAVNRVVEQVNYSLQGNDWAAVNAVMRTSTSPEFIGDFRNLAKDVGSFIAPIALWFKGIFGGFSAGTYAEIMPQVVSFGIAISLIIAPILMMLGLMLPMYAMNAIMLPILLIAYLGAVKITFTLIRVFAGIFNTAYTAGNITSEQARLVDIAMGNAYGAAFLLTGAILIMLRNPSAILQKLGGSADKASSVSFQEVMAAGGAMALAKKATGAVAAVASGGAAAAVGKVAGSLVSGNVLRNQMTGLKAGYLGGAKQAQKYEADAAELDALSSDDTDESVGRQLRKNEQLKGMGSGEELKDMLDPEIQSEKKKTFQRSVRDRVASQRGLKKLTRGTRRTITKIDPETGESYKEHEDLDPFLDDLEDAIVEGLLAREPEKYNRGEGEGLDRVKADASKQIVAAIRRNMVTKNNTEGHLGPDGRANKNVVNALAAKIEAEVMKVQPLERPDTETKKDNAPKE